MTERAPEVVEALIVQLEAGSVLLPRSALLEVTTRPGGMQTERAHPEFPWLEPNLVWQDVQVPVVNVSRLLDPEQEIVDSQRRFTRLMVMQAVDQPQRLPFYALEVRGTPHPVRITQQNIYPLEDVDSTPWAWRVKASGVTTQLLRLDVIEQRLLALGEAGAAATS